MINVPYNVKTLLHEDHCYKNIRIHFPGGERQDICNDLIVKDSVSFTESLCSRDSLSFGLCEASTFECETVGVGNIKGAKIEVYCEVECNLTAPGKVWKADLQKYVYPIPYGVFVVDSCQRQADMQHRKIVAYSEVATKEWDICAIERNKVNFGGTYTPNMGYFYAANGIPMVKSLCDESISDMTLTTSESMFVVRTESYVIQDKWTITVEAYKYTWQTAPDGFYQFEVDSDAMSRKEEIEKQVRRIYPINELTEEDAARARALAYPQFLLYRQVSDDQSTASYFCTYGTSEYIYPYVNNFYEKTNYYTYVTYRVPKRYHAKRTDRWWNPRTRQYETRTLAEFELNFNLTGAKKRHHFTYKNEFSYLNDYAYSFPMQQTTLQGKSAYIPTYDEEFSIHDEIESFANFFGLMAAFDREGGAKLISLKRLFNLVPESDLYPNTNVYPQRVTGGELYPYDYQTCWYDDEYTKLFGKIYCEYKDTNDADAIYELYLTGYDSDSDPDSYQVYNLSSNKMIKNGRWTQAQMQTICENIAANIDNVSYMPVDFVGRGLPYVEAGDTFEILTRSNDSITTIVLNRTISGEMTLTDSYKSV